MERWDVIKPQIPLLSDFLISACKTVSRRSTSLVGAGDSACRRMPNAGTAGCQGGTWDWPTPRQFFWGSVGNFPSDGQGGRGPLVSGSGEDSTAYMKLFAAPPSSYLTAPSALLLLCPGRRPLRYRATPAGFQGGASFIGGSPPIAEIPVASLVVRRAISAIPREATRCIWRDPAFKMGDNTMRKGGKERRWLRLGLPGTCLPASGCCRAPTRRL